MADEKNQRKKASERRAAAAKGSNPFSTVSASKRRAERAARSSSSVTSASSEKQDGNLDQTMIADILAHPTKQVSEEELRQEYSYVLSDLRNMGLLALSLIVLLIILAQVLPK